MRRALEQILAVVKDHDVPCACQTGADPVHVVRSAHLLVAGSCRVPVFQDAWRIALRVAGRIAETVQEIARRTGGLGDAGLRVAGDERAVVVDHVQLALHGVDDDVARLGVVVHRIAVQPVAFQRSAGQVEVDAARDSPQWSCRRRRSWAWPDRRPARRDRRTTIPRRRSPAYPPRRRRPSARLRYGPLSGSAPAAMACSWVIDLLAMYSVVGALSCLLKIRTQS